MVQVRRPRRRNRLRAFFDEGRGFVDRLEQLRFIPPTVRVGLAVIEDQLLDYFDRLLDAADGGRPQLRHQLKTLATSLEGASGAFERANDALDEGDWAGYQVAIAQLVKAVPH